MYTLDVAFLRSKAQATDRLIYKQLWTKSERPGPTIGVKGIINNIVKALIVGSWRLKGNQAAVSHVEKGVDTN